MPGRHLPPTRTVSALTSDTLIFKIKLVACKKLPFCHSCAVGALPDLLSPPDSSRIGALPFTSFDHLTPMATGERNMTVWVREVLRGEAICFGAQLTRQAHPSDRGVARPGSRLAVCGVPAG